MDVTIDRGATAADGRIQFSGLDALLAASADELARAYREAATPTVGELDGALRGRMLAVPLLRGLVADVARRFASSELFPWRGKTFSSAGDHGEGVNRVFSDRLTLFRFTTSVGKSRAGDFDAVQLDYDHPGNPFFIRAVKDEVRRLRAGLFLGQAYLHARGKDTLVLYFGLERK